MPTLEDTALPVLLLPLADLKAHPRNYRTHPEDQLTHLEQSLREHGWFRPIVVANDNTILAGHGIAQAARRLGWTEAPVVRLDLASDSPKALKVLTADNELGRLAIPDDAALANLLREIDRDLDLLGTGFDDQALRDLLADLGGDLGTLGLTDPDDVPEPPDDPITQPGDLWLLGAHRLLCGDATSEADVRRLLDGDVPALMVTDPPYGVGYDAAWRDEAAAAGLINHAASRVGAFANDNRVDWHDAWALFPGDVAYCWHAGRHASAVQASLESVGFEIRCQVIWAKQTFAISRGHYHWRHEPCWYAVRNGKQAHWIGDRSQSTLWDITWDKNVEGGHSTQKPVECMARPIRNHDGDVYDPFLGSGTTLIAADQLGRRCYGLEIDPKYCDVIVNRWQNFTGQTAEPASSSSAAA